jgi:hypothetical protein
MCEHIIRTLIMPLVTTIKVFLVSPSYCRRLLDDHKGEFVRVQPLSSLCGLLGWFFLLICHAGIVPQDRYRYNDSSEQWSAD